MCQRIGRPPTGTMGLGRYSVSSRNRVPKPPQRMTTFIGYCCQTLRVGHAQPQSYFVTTTMGRKTAKLVLDVTETQAITLNKVHGIQ